MVSKVLGFPTVWHIREIMPASRFSPLRAFIRYAVGRCASVGICVSKSVHKDINITGNITIIYDGIPVERFLESPDTDSIRQELGIGSQTGSVAFIGQIKPGKGLETYLRAAAIVAEERPDTKFFIVGGEVLTDSYKASFPRRILRLLSPADYEETIKKLAEKLNVSDRVRFTGFLENIAPTLAAMDIIVIPSRCEPFGRVAVEAMAMKKAVVASDAGGLRLS